MKNKKLLSVLSLSAMLASIASPAMATDITMDGPDANVGYSAYQLLTVTTSLNNGADHSGDVGGKHSPNCYNYAYSVNAKYRQILADYFHITVNTSTPNATYDTDQAIIDKIDALDADDADGAKVRAFANAVWAQIDAGNLTPEANANASDKFTDANGYYLITETGDIADNDSRSLVMLDTAGADNLTVTTKEGVPTLEKTVADTGSDEYTESVTARIGEAVSFKLVGTVTKEIKNYPNYKYEFHDTLSQGLAYKPNSMQVSVDNGGTKTVLPASTYDVITSPGDTCNLEVKFADLKKACADNHITLDANSKIIAIYKAVVQDESKLNFAKTGNPNTAQIAYSNDPYATGNLSKTPTDQANVFSFQLTVDKVDKFSAPLEGAGFTLEKKDADGNYVEIETIAPADLASATDKTKFVFDGLDNGEYCLRETTIPDGYTRARDLYFSIESTFDGTDVKVAQTLKTLTVKNEAGTVDSGAAGSGKTFTVSVDAGTMGLKVMNKQGVHMPTTGAMGTMALYGGGAILLAGGLMLILKRRKNSQQA